MKKSICGAAFLNLIFSVAAFAQDGEVLSGNDFYDACVSEGDTLQAFCAGYLIGFQEGRKYGTFLLMLQAADEGESTAEIDAASDQLVGNCIPKGVEFSQLKKSPSITCATIRKADTKARGLRYSRVSWKRTPANKTASSPMCLSVGGIRRSPSHKQSEPVAGSFHRNQRISSGVVPDPR